MLKGYKQFDTMGVWKELILLLKQRFVSVVEKCLRGRKTILANSGLVSSIVHHGVSVKKLVSFNMKDFKTKPFILGGKETLLDTTEYTTGSQNIMVNQKGAIVVGSTILKKNIIGPIYQVNI